MGGGQGRGSGSFGGSKPRESRLGCFHIKGSRFVEGDLACFHNNLKEGGDPDLYFLQKGREIEMLSATEIKSHFGFSIHYFWKKIRAQPHY